MYERSFIGYSLIVLFYIIMEHTELFLNRLVLGPTSKYGAISLLTFTCISFDCSSFWLKSKPVTWRPVAYIARLSTVSRV